MATDIFSILVDILKINQNLVYQYASQGTLYQLFYLFFFPILFIVIFIYIVAGWAMPQHRGLRFLISMAVFAFIVLEGWYSFFVSMSKFWLFLTVLLGFLVFIFSKKGGGGGAKGKVLGASGGGILGDLKKRAKGEITGEFKQREHMINSMLDQIDDAMKKAGGSQTDIDNILGGGGGAMIMMARIHQMIWDMRQDSAVWNFASDRVIRLIKKHNKVAHALGAKTMPEK